MKLIIKKISKPHAVCGANHTYGWFRNIAQGATFSDHLMTTRTNGRSYAWCLYSDRYIFSAFVRGKTPSPTIISPPNIENI